MTIEEVYREYEIMPSLRLHMYRVASVASMICEARNDVHEKNAILISCLLHDMGNIIKFKLELFPSFLEPLGFLHWQKVQQEYIKKYGKDEHIATLRIVEELGLPRRIYELVDGFEFLRAEKTLASGDLSQMICSYSDMRVDPMGVVSLEERLADGRKRFRLRKSDEYREELFQKTTHYLHRIESKLFESIPLKNSDVTEENIQPIIKDLMKFEIF